MFCPKCDTILVPARRIDKSAPVNALMCPECHYRDDKPENLEGFIIKEQITHDETSKIEVVEFNELEGIPDEIREELLETYRETLENFDL